jgi:hypothetical protein
MYQTDQPYADIADLVDRYCYEVEVANGVGLKDDLM